MKPTTRIKSAIYDILIKYKLHDRVNRRIFPGKVKARTGDGKQFYLYNPPFLEENLIFWRGLENMDWERKTREVWSDLCTRSAVIFDIGANSGIFSMLAKVYNPDASVYSFEPQPNIYKVLKKNSDINGFGISCQNLALSNVAGTFPFYNFGDDPFGRDNTTAGSLNKEWRPKNQKHIDVKVVTLNAFVKEENIEKIDLIKLDVETLEAEVLEGYNEYLLVHQPIIILEIQSAEIGQRIQGFFDDSRYSYFNIDESKGLVATTSLGGHEHRNYLICPNEKLDQIQEATG